MDNPSAADNHYPTMTVEELFALPLADHLAPDAALFLWVTVPFLAVAFRLIEHWGFEYKSQMVWVKDRIGTGYWFRNRHELLLVATRGDIPAPAMGTQFDSVIEAAAAGTRPSRIASTRSSRPTTRRCRRSSCSHARLGQGGRGGARKRRASRVRLIEQALQDAP